MKRLEVAKKSGDANRGRLQPSTTGENNPAKRPEVRAKISMAKIGKPRPGFGRTQVGENNPNWHGGTGNFPYPFEFNEEFKTRVRERDNNTCQLCGRTEEEEGQSLAVHHVYYDRENPDMVLERFITLCNSCNNKVNSNRADWTRFFESKLKKEV